MEVSDCNGELEGEELIQTLVSLMGLPEAGVRHELDGLLELSGKNSQDLTLDQLREVLVLYLESIQAEFTE